MIPSYQELNDNRRRGSRIVGYFQSFCDLNSCCEECDHLIHFGCTIKRLIENAQKKRILRICKPEEYVK